MGDAYGYRQGASQKRGVRLHGRVSQIERDLLTGDATVTLFGTLTGHDGRHVAESVATPLKGNSQQNARSTTLRLARPFRGSFSFSRR